MSQENSAENPDSFLDEAQDQPPQSYIGELRSKRRAEPTPFPKREQHEARQHEPVSELAPDTSAAHRLVRALVEAGVDTFFGIPGGPISPVFDAILCTRGARLIESRHETSAAFAAADYYRASGRVPAVVVTAGPGATNVVTGVVSAHLERIPMLVICGDVAWAAGGGRLLQDSGPEGIAIEKLLANVTRATVRVAQAKTATTQGLAALGAAKNPANPGPALLVLPIQFGRAPAPFALVEAPTCDFSARASARVVAQTASWLASAERPLLIIGAGCRPYADALRRLVDAFGIPFVTTPQAKGIVSELHPRSLRHGGLGASLWAREYTAGGVDVALALGTDLDDCSIGPTRYIAEGGRLVHVDLNAAVFGRNLPTELGVVADIGAFVEDLQAFVTSEGLQHPSTRATLRELRGKSPFEHADFARDDRAQITPQRALADLEAALPEETAFISDIGEHMLFALHYLTARSPDSFTIHLGLGSMGSGISGSIGLALARPDRPVVCICGDGGMQMVGMEALVALKYRLPIVFAVFNDARYNMVYHGYRQVFGREAQWESPWTDFAAWARSMGMVGLRVNHPGEISGEQLARLRELGVPTVLDIRIDREQRLTGGGRNEALRHMSMLNEAG
ncbi:MAG TPA: thiamine pyrophosphate-binding protein [Polyangiaceae bacterium]|jgi:acetolactate synthase-1/2/3 large subunit|nr:thiamine pyrophosphate-binding protein [Polyangiaceae bacterium]